MRLLEACAIAAIFSPADSLQDAAVQLSSTGTLNELSCDTG